MAKTFCARPLGDRKERVARLLGGRRLGIVLSDHTDDDGATIFRQACVMGLEGIVSKRLSAPHRSGSSRDWLKIKNPDSPAPRRARAGLGSSPHGLGSELDSADSAAMADPPSSRFRSPWRMVEKPSCLQVRDGHDRLCYRDQRQEHPRVRRR
jgi:hypothetical protein